VTGEMYVMVSPSRPFAMLGYDIGSWIAAALQPISKFLFCAFALLYLDAHL
jgi:hypothetical protein